MKQRVPRLLWSLFLIFFLVIILCVSTPLITISPSVSSENKSFEQEIMSLSFDNIKTASVCPKIYSFDPHGEYPLDEKSCITLLKFMQETVENKRFIKKASGDEIGGWVKFSIQTNTGRKFVISDSPSSIGFAINIDGYIYKVNGSFFNEFYETCHANAYEKAMSAPIFFSETKPNSVSEVFLRSETGSYALSEIDKETLASHLQLYFESFCNQNYEEYDTRISGGLIPDGFASPVETEILCTYDIIVGDSEPITVEIGEEYLVINDVGYKVENYDVLRDWTLELLE